MLQRTGKLLAFVVLALSLGGTVRMGTSVQAASPGPAGTATVRTDKFDYQPGEYAKITGSGFLSGEQVLLQVVHVNGLNGGSGHEPFLTGADGDGQIAEQWYVNPDDSAHAIFKLTAVGQTSGRAARTVFTDAAITVLDDNGADDYPGQKDLNFFTFDYGNPGATSISVMWGWDDTSWSGGNTGDGCTLFDTDQDGKANYSFCVSVGGIVADYLPPARLYQCSDGRSDRCTQSTPITTFSSTADAFIIADSDPFRALASHASGNKCGAKPGCVTADTVATVNIVLADVGAGAAKLINVCSYPSQVPNSDPSECVITPNNGFLTIKKHAPAGTSLTWRYDLGANQTFEGGATFQTVATTNGEGQTQFISMKPRTSGDANAYDLTEVIPATWQLTGVTCAVQTSPTTPTGTATSTGVNNFEIVSGLETICEFTNGRTDPSLKLTKKLVLSYGWSASTSDFTLKAGTTVFTSGVAKSIAAGTHALTEETGSDLSGTFDASLWSCTGNATPLNGNSLTIASGETVECEITNTGKPATLIVEKLVVNDNGGTLKASDFSFQYSPGGSPTAFTVPDAAKPLEGKNTLLLSQGTYSVTEPNVPAGYSQTPVYTNCTSIVIKNGGTATCSIINNDAKASPGTSSDQSAVLHDSAEFTGLRAGAPVDQNNPAATITFSLHTAAGCAAAPVATAEQRSITYSNSGTVGSASTVIGVLVNPPPSGNPPSASATYWWKVVYSGDAFNEARTDCVETTAITFTPK